MIKFNMNNYVWFEPTELGLQVFVDYHKEFGFDHKLEVVNGKACLQFHNFIQIYGDYITSYCCPLDEVFKHYEFCIDYRVDVTWTVDYCRPDLELYRYETCSSLEEALDWYKKQDLEASN